MSFQSKSVQDAHVNFYYIVTLFNVRNVPCEESWEISFIKPSKGRMWISQINLILLIMI